MKKVLLLLAVVITTSVNAQLNKGYSNKTYSNSVGIGHINETGDTLYILVEMFPIMDTIWNLPINRDEKPVLIPVESIVALKTSLIGREEKK